MSDWDKEQLQNEMRRRFWRKWNKERSRVVIGRTMTVSALAQGIGIDVGTVLSVLQRLSYHTVQSGADEIGEAVVNDFLDRLAREAAGQSPSVAEPTAPRQVEHREAVRFDGMSLRISDKLAAALLMTPHRPDAKPIGEKFSVVVSPPLGPLATIRIVGDEWKAYTASGAEHFVDDAAPILRNIGFGACDLLANQKGKRASVRYEDDGSPLPVRRLKPTHEIKVTVGADLRPLAIEILEGKKTFEVATTEAIFVRGHWVNQPCGEGARQRKHVWRQPHYRGKGQRGGRAYELATDGAK